MEHLKWSRQARARDENMIPAMDSRRKPRYGRTNWDCETHVVVRRILRRVGKPRKISDRIPVRRQEGEVQFLRLLPAHALERLILSLPRSDALPRLAIKENADKDSLPSPANAVRSHSRSFVGLAVYHILRYTQILMRGFLYQRMTRKRQSWAFRLIAAMLLVAMPSPALAAFVPHYLLSDQDVRNGTAMTRAGIADFLKNKGSALAAKKFSTSDGEKTAAQIIYEVGKRWDISQKYLLVRLQVEQSLVTDTSPSQRQLDWATGYSCRDGGVCDNEYKGFYKQVEWSAKALRSDRYFGGIEKNGHTISGWGPNITKKTLDGIEVTPMNAATAVLYTYTPWVGKYGGGDQRYGGSSLIWKKYNDWFFRKFPEGALINELGTNTYYRIENGKKRQYRSSALVSNADPRKALPASAAELAAYENGDPIVFANYSLVRSPRGTVFLIVDGKKRGIVSREVFRTIGFNPEEVQKAEWADINYYPDGPVIDLTSAYPQGALLKAKETGGIAYVENGVRHAIYSREILYSRFKGRPTITVTESELEQYPVGEPALFADGELVTAEGQPVFFIAGGLRHPVASRDVFDRMGFKWGNILKTSDRSLEVHPLGDPVNIEDPVDVE